MKPLPWRRGCCASRRSGGAAASLRRQPHRKPAAKRKRYGERNGGICCVKVARNAAKKPHNAASTPGENGAPPRCSLRAGGDGINRTRVSKIMAATKRRGDEELLSSYHLAKPVASEAAEKRHQQLRHPARGVSAATSWAGVAAITPRRYGAETRSMARYRRWRGAYVDIDVGKAKACQKASNQAAPAYCLPALPLSRRIASALARRGKHQQKYRRRLGPAALARHVEGKEGGWGRRNGHRNMSAVRGKGRHSKCLCARVAAAAWAGAALAGARLSAADARRQRILTAALNISAREN